MKQFKLEERKAELLTLEIQGKTYSFNPKSLVVQTAVEKFNTCQQPLIKKLEKGNMSKEELNKAAIQSCRLVQETVNKILGKNTYEKMFAKRSIDFEENQQLMIFIFQAITEFYHEHPVEKTNN